MFLKKLWGLRGVTRCATSCHPQSGAMLTQLNNDDQKFIMAYVSRSKSGVLFWIIKEP
jgi:hypothetical protein